MKFDPPLENATLVRRYKRFLADIATPDGRKLTIHCPNTGSMKNCATPGDEVFYSTSDNSKRKYAHTWELTRTARRHFIGINTGTANKLVREGIEEGGVPELAGYAKLSGEVAYGEERSRVDLLLSEHARHPDCYVEVKSVTLLESPYSRGVGYFPDAVSTRGTRHLRELAAMAQAGYRAVLFYCVQHSGIREVRPAQHIDPDYAQALAEAHNRGVEVIAYKVRMSPRSLSLSKPLNVIVNP